MPGRPLNFLPSLFQPSRVQSWDLCDQPGGSPPMHRGMDFLVAFFFRPAWSYSSPPPLCFLLLISSCWSSAPPPSPTASISFLVLDSVAFPLPFSLDKILFPCLSKTKNKKTKKTNKKNQKKKTLFKTSCSQRKIKTKTA